MGKRIIQSEDFVMSENSVATGSSIPSSVTSDLIAKIPEVLCSANGPANSSKGGIVKLANDPNGVGAKLLNGYGLSQPVGDGDNKVIYGLANFRIDRESVQHAYTGHFSHRTRLNVGDVLYKHTCVDPVVAADKLTLTHPLCLSVLADDDAVEVLYKFLSSPDVIHRLAVFLTGPTRKIRKGTTKRFSFVDLFNFVANEFGSFGVRIPRLESLERGTGETEVMQLSRDQYLGYVATRIIFDTIKDLDVHYNLLSLHYAIEDVVTTVEVDDLRRLMREGEVYRLFSLGEDWVDTRYLKDFKDKDEIWDRVIEEMLSTSFLNFRLKLSRLSLFNDEFDAVLACARMACAYQMGIKHSFGDFTVAETAVKSQSIQAVGRLFCIQNDILNGTLFDELSLAAYYARGLNASIIVDRADTLLQNLERHPLVERVSAGSLIDSLEIVRSNLNYDGFHFQTTIGNSNLVKGERFIFNEFNAGANIFRPIVNTPATKTLGAACDFNKITSALMLNHCLDSEVIARSEYFERISDKGSLVNDAEVQLCVYNVDPLALRILNLKQFEIIMDYEQKADDKMTSDKVHDWAYCIPTEGGNLVTAFNVIKGDMYIKGDATAAFFSKEKSGRKANTVNRRVIKQSLMDNKDYLVKWSEMHGVRTLPKRIAGTFTLMSASGAVPCKCRLDSSKLFNVSATVPNFVYHNSDALTEVQMLQILMLRSIEIAQLTDYSGMQFNRSYVEQG